MKSETIEKILNFLQNNEGKKLPKSWFDSIEKLKLIKELENHPDDIKYRYEGDLELSETNITKLPNDLYVVGSLNLWKCQELTKLPDKLHVGDDLNIEGTNIEEIPNNLYVGGYLSLYGCTQITKLPNDLYVGDYLNIEGTNIEEIPNNLYVEFDLYIENTPLSDKYTHEEIYEMVRLRGGEIKWDIYS
jgi:hypothetical protein